MDDAEEVRAYYRAILPFYDASLANRGDLPFWESIARRFEAKRILELGCGTGRVTAVLSQLGAVTAVDLLVEMLERASRRAPRAQLVAADLRRFAFCMRFDLVVLADDPIAHLTSAAERHSVMQLVAEHLTSGGQVVLEGLYRPPRRQNVVSSRNVFMHEGNRYAVEESWAATSEESVWKARYRYERDSTTTEVSTIVKSWTMDEVDQLSMAGLRIENVWGDFDERPFSESAARIVIVARKSGTTPVLRPIPA